MLYGLSLTSFNLIATNASQLITFCIVYVSVCLHHRSKCAEFVRSFGCYGVAMNGRGYRHSRPVTYQRPLSSPIYCTQDCLAGEERAYNSGWRSMQGPTDCSEMSKLERLCSTRGEASEIGARCE